MRLVTNGGLKSRLGGCAILLALGVAACNADRPQTEVLASPPLSVTPGAMDRIGTVDDRYQSYNIEMLEVTGGRFWKPYKDIAKPAGQSGLDAKSGDAPAAMSPDPYP